MAEVIPTRKEWQAPDHSGEASAYLAAFEKMDKKLEELDKTGRMASFPVGDGYAYYHVTSWSPLQLEHFPAGDGYTVAEAMLKGLEPEDLKRYGVTANIPTGVKLNPKADRTPGAMTITAEQLAAIPKALEYTVSGCVDVKTREGTWRYAFTAQMLVKGLLVHRYTITSPLVVREVSKDKLRNAIAEAIGVQRRFVKW